MFQLRAYPISTSAVMIVIMLDTPRLSASLKSSTDSSPRTPLSIDQFILQSPSCKHPNDDKELESFKMESPESPPQTTFNPTLPWLQSPKRGDSVFQKRTLEANRKMRKIYTPYKLRTSIRPLELRFALRSLGRTSHTSLTLEDVLEVSSSYPNVHLWHSLIPILN